jgi:hypothetical protein
MFDEALVRRRVLMGLERVREPLALWQCLLSLGIAINGSF